MRDEQDEVIVTAGGPPAGRYEPQPRNVYEPLIRLPALDALSAALHDLGETDLARDAIEALRRQAPMLERIAVDAVSALNGDGSAGERLELLTGSPAEPALTSRAWFDHLAPVDPSAERIVINGDTLLQAVTGNCWSSTDRRVSVTRLKALGAHLAQAFFVERLAHAAAEAKAGHPRSLANLSAVWRADERRRADRDCPNAIKAEPLFRPEAPPPPHAPSPDWQRIPADVAEWLGEWTGPSWGCLDGEKVGMCVRPGIGTPAYRIVRLSDPRACAGQTLTIYGTNFGQTGEVWFPNVDFDDPFMIPYVGSGAVGPVPAVRWTDTEIDVVVPRWATAGEIHLGAYSIRVDGCKTMYLYRSGNARPFYGGRSKVTRLAVNGATVDLDDPARVRLLPSQPLEIAYTARGGGSPAMTPVTVEVWLRRDGDGQTVHYAGGLPAIGAHSFYPPTVTTVTAFTLLVRANGPCGPVEPVEVPVLVSRPPEISVAWVEVTQGVQIGRHWPEKIVTVADKDTAIRVHFYCDRQGFASDVARVSGHVRIDGGPAVPAQRIATLVGDSSDDDMRETLNVLLPAALATAGAHSLRFEMTAHFDGDDSFRFEHETRWVWMPVTPLRVNVCHGLRPIGPDTQSAVDYAREALNYLPTPVHRVGTAFTTGFPHWTNLSTRDGWSDLLDWLEDEHEDAEAPASVLWLGVVPHNPNSSFGGVGGMSHTPSRAAVALDDRADVGAHELGHALGLDHTFQPKTIPELGGPEGPFDDASNDGMHVRPYLEVARMQQVPPPAGDLMSYRSGVAPDGRLVVAPVRSTWERLFNKFLLGWY